MVEIDLRNVIAEAHKDIFYQRLAELIYETQLKPLGW